MPKYGLIENLERWGYPTEKYSYDQEADRMTVDISQNYAPFIDYNKRLLRDADYDGYTPSRDLQRVATIPPIIIEKWLREENINIYKDEDWPKVVQKLDDPDYRWLRCSDGHIGKKPTRKFFRGSTT